MADAAEGGPPVDVPSAIAGPREASVAGQVFTLRPIAGAAAQDARRAPPLLDVDTRRHHCRVLTTTANAERMRVEGRGLGIFRDPGSLAKFNRFSVRMRGNDDERTTAAGIVFTWSWCRRERGIRVYCELARAYLLRAQIAHNDADVWLMALELAVPHGALLAGMNRVVERQQHCPEEIIRRLAFRHE